MAIAWSHGTSSRTVVSVPWTAGSNTTFRPLISWIKRKKSLRSRSFTFMLIGSPVKRVPVQPLVGTPELPAETCVCCCSAALVAAGLVARLALDGNGALLVAGAVGVAVEKCAAACAARDWLAFGLTFLAACSVCFGLHVCATKTTCSVFLPADRFVSKYR